MYSTLEVLMHNDLQLLSIILHQNLDHKFYIFTDESSISLIEQYTTADKYLRAGRFNPKVFVKCSLNCTVSS